MTASSSSGKPYIRHRVQYSLNGALADSQLGGHCLSGYFVVLFNHCSDLHLLLFRRTQSAIQSAIVPLSVFLAAFIVSAPTPTFAAVTVEHDGKPISLFLELIPYTSFCAKSFNLFQAGSKGLHVFGVIQSLRDQFIPADCLLISFRKLFRCNFSGKVPGLYISMRLRYTRIWILWPDSI